MSRHHTSGIVRDECGTMARCCCQQLRQIAYSLLRQAQPSSQHVATGNSGLLGQLTVGGAQQVPSALQRDLRQHVFVPLELTHRVLGSVQHCGSAAGPYVRLTGQQTPLTHVVPVGQSPAKLQTAIRKHLCQTKIAAASCLVGVGFHACTALLISCLRAQRTSAYAEARLPSNFWPHATTLE